MRTGSLISGLAVLAAAAACILAFTEYRAANRVADELVAMRQQRADTSLPELEEKLRAAERRAADAERDVNELLKAVRSVGARTRTQLVVANRPPDSAAPVVLTTGSVNPPESNRSVEENQRLAQERRYQQELAKKRAAEARARAEFDHDIHVRTVDPAARFHKATQRAQQLAANGEFQAAIRTLNQAMAEKPADVPLPDDVRELQAMLRSQNSPVEVTLLSDGATFVSILGARAPQQFARTTVKLLPGDYHLVGRRPGFRDVEMLVKVRTDAPPPAATVICTQALAAP